MTDLTGRILKNRYRIDAFLGRGGMAEVYRAFDTIRHYNVAIKIMHADLAEDREFVRRFRREAENMALLSHDNIVRFHSLEHHNQLLFLVMDYVEGVTLSSVLAQTEEPLPLAQVNHIFRQLCQGFYYAHEEGLVHRDIKPANVMLQPDGRVLITDFGIAKATDATTLTTTDKLGTVVYMSPEQCLGRRLDRRSDIYTLGIVLYEMLTGYRPFRGESDIEIGDLKQKFRWEHLHQPPPSPTEYNPELSEQMEQVLLKALAKNPNDRFPTMLAFYQAFEEALGEWQIYSIPSSQEVETELPPLFIPEAVQAEVPSKSGLGWLGWFVFITLTISFIGVVGFMFIGWYNPIFFERVLAGEISLSPTVTPTLPPPPVIDPTLRREESDQDFAISYNNRGIDYYDQGRYDEAIQHFNEALKYKADFVEAYYNRGLAYFDKQDYTAALADFDRAIQLKPNYAPAYYGRALSYEMTHDKARAIADYEKCFQLSDDPVLRQQVETRLQTLKQGN